MNLLKKYIKINVGFTSKYENFLRGNMKINIKFTIKYQIS